MNNGAKLTRRLPLRRGGVAAARFLRLTSKSHAARKAVVAAALAVSCTGVKFEALGNEILDWDAAMMAAIRLDNSGPTLSTRNLAILHLAMYDAVNSIARRHQPYAFLLDPPEPSSPEAAAAGAGDSVLRALYPGMTARADEVSRLWRASAPNTQATTNGLEFGIECARRILEARSGDGSATDIPYVPSTAPGNWRRTAPFYRPPLTPGWRYVRPFALPELEPFVAPPPPALDSPDYANDLNEVRALGRRDSLERTPEQSLIAAFWSDFSYTAMPPGHWHEIASSIARQRGTDLPDAARLMALLSLVQADAAIVCWEAKYRYNLWRPITAIQRAAEDGNPGTDADPDWDNYLAAPPFPAYPSGHSTFSQGGAEAIGFFYGADAIDFSASSDAVPGVVRSFHSLRSCAAEVGMSRIYGGIHFSFDNREGKRSGSKVAAHVTSNWLLPNADLPQVRLEAGTTRQPGVRVHGTIGSRVVLEASSDLKRWASMATNAAIPGGFLVPSDFTDQQRYFRAREIPMR